MVRVRSGAVGAALLVLCACGTTTGPESLSAGGGSEGGEFGSGVGDGDGAGASGASSTGSGGLGSPGSAGTGGAGAAGGSNGTGSAGSPGPGGAGTGGQIALGRGVSASEIRIGFNYIGADTVNEATAAFGGSSVSDPTVQANAVVQYINGIGGIAGRELVPVLRNSNNINNLDANDQAACSYFTQDQEALAVVSISVGTEVLSECLAQAGTPVVRDFFGLLLDQQDFDALGGFFYQPDSLRAERAGAAWIDNLHSAGYFDPGARIGLIYRDTPANHRVMDSTIDPRMAALGLQFIDEVQMGDVNSLDDLGAVAAQMANAVLRFRTQNITHVMFWATSSLGPAFFGDPAESQGYRPRYGLTSLELPYQLVDAGFPPEQAHRAVATGWMPPVDVNTGEDPGGNATAILCDQIYRDAGVPPVNRVDVHQALLICGQLLFVKAALDNAPALTAEGFSAGVDGLGSQFQFSTTLSTLFGPSRYDGAASVRSVVFDDACACFRYSGSTQPVP